MLNLRRGSESSFATFGDGFIADVTGSERLTPDNNALLASPSLSEPMSRESESTTRIILLPNSFINSNAQWSVALFDNSLFFHSSQLFFIILIPKGKYRSLLLQCDSSFPKTGGLQSAIVIFQIYIMDAPRRILSYTKTPRHHNLRITLINLLVLLYLLIFVPGNNEKLCCF